MRPGPALRSVAAACALFALLLGSGCFHHPEDYCRGCTLVRFDQPTPPPPRRGQTGLVILLHGAFGFGDEWAPIRAALATRPELATWTFVWQGPFGGGLVRGARGFLSALQRALLTLPPSTREVLVLAHSAGGILGDWVARRVTVPPGVTLHVALIDAPQLRMLPARSSREVDTPLGIAVGTEPPARRRVAPGVVLTDWRAADPPAVAPPSDARLTWLGRHVTHTGAVALVGLPLLGALGRPANGPGAAAGSTAGSSR